MDDSLLSAIAPPSLLLGCTRQSPSACFSKLCSASSVSFPGGVCAAVEVREISQFRCNPSVFPL
eukprot:7229951-Prorocentrum_lima.AAC.1